MGQSTTENDALRESSLDGTEQLIRPKKKSALSAVLTKGSADNENKNTDNDDNASIHSTLTSYQRKEAELLHRLQQIQREKEAELLAIRNAVIEETEREDETETGVTLETSHSTDLGLDDDEEEDFGEVKLKEKKRKDEKILAAPGPGPSTQPIDRRGLLKRQKGFAKRYESSHPMTLTELMQREAKARKASMVEGTILAKKKKKKKTLLNKNKSLRFATSRKFQDKIWCLVRHFDQLQGGVPKSALFWSDAELDLLFASETHANNNNYSANVERNFVKALRTCYDPVRTPDKYDDGTNVVGAVRAARRPVPNPDAIRPFCLQHRRALLNTQQELMKKGQKASNEDFGNALRQVSLKYSLLKNQHMEKDDVVDGNYVKNARTRKQRSSLKKMNSSGQLMPHDGKERQRSLSPRRSLRKGESLKGLELPDGKERQRSLSPRRSLRKGESLKGLEFPANGDETSPTKQSSGKLERKRSPRRSLRKSDSFAGLESRKQKEVKQSKADRSPRRSLRKSDSFSGLEAPKPKALSKKSRGTSDPALAPPSNNNKSPPRSSIRKDNKQGKQSSSSPLRSSRKKLKPMRSDSRLEALEPQEINEGKLSRGPSILRQPSGEIEPAIAEFPLSQSKPFDNPRQSLTGSASPKGLTMSPVRAKKSLKKKSLDMESLI